jgi:hypothetical protein
MEEDIYGGMEEDIYGGMGEIYEGEEDVYEPEDIEALRETEEETEYVPGYEEMAALRYRPGGVEIIEGISKGLQKSMRTPEEATLEQAQGVLAGSTYDDLTDVRKERVISIIEKTKGNYLLHVETLVLAAIWLAEAKPLNKNNYQVFSKKYKLDTAQQVDMLRYIRMLGV